MTTVLYFQELTWIATDLARRDILLSWPKKQWKFANSLSVPTHYDAARWNEAYDSYYGFDR